MWRHSKEGASHGYNIIRILLLSFSINKIRSISTGSPPNEKENLKMEISNAYQPLLYKETQEKDNLQSLLTGKDSS